jgi:HAE1 family hydrophobic/amphiphilic exporter-1
MTSLAFGLGCVPLAIASGSGAIARQVMGTGVIGGMLMASFIAIFLIPVTFYLVEKLAHRGEPATGHAAALAHNPHEHAKKGDEHA